MRTQVRKFLRSMTPYVRSALVQASAAGIAACVGWIPASLGSPGAIVAQVESSQHCSSPSVRRGLRESKAACPDCYSGSTRKVRLSYVVSGMRRCANRASPTVTPPGVSQGEVNADLLILLEWHMTASNGYNLGHDNAACSAKAGMVAPMPLEASEVYEMLARSSDNADDAQAGTGLMPRGQVDPAAAARRETE